MDRDRSFTLHEFKQGDPSAFSQIVDEHSPKIYNLALSMLRDPQEAEDVLQETFLNAFSARSSFRGDSAVGTWLYRIATNQALMRLRKKVPPTVSVHEPLEGRDGELFPRQLKDWCCLPERDFMTSETQAKLNEAIESLSLPLRVVFIMRDIQGLSTRETADILEISESAVKTRLMRARLQLRDELSVYFSERI